ncbi:hypothetical protein Zmor_004888 [Zophobas morio]|uniref:Uncharacterized protein n=1 Tax=Zophobas morio TaxID=2755281 RepID=A0AA38IT13_9CUCU|nr:hypothetical protein Zmor_004888 [Zophobas morio]
MGSSMYSADDSLSVATAGEKPGSGSRDGQSRKTSITKPPEGEFGLVAGTIIMQLIQSTRRLVNEFSCAGIILYTVV